MRTSTDHCVLLVRPVAEFLPSCLLDLGGEALGAILACRHCDVAGLQAMQERRCAAACASPQMPTEICFTSPSMRGSASTWMIFAFFGQ